VFTFREKLTAIGLLSALFTLGCLVPIMLALVIGVLLQLLLGWNWLVSSICALTLIKFLMATLDLFDFKKKNMGPPCPHCGEQLRTPKAQQCFQCGEKWHGKSLERDDDA